MLTLIDDLALNAQQVTGVYADRELPVVMTLGVYGLVGVQQWVRTMRR